MLIQGKVHDRDKLIAEQTVFNIQLIMLNQIATNNL